MKSFTLRLTALWLTTLVVSCQRPSAEVGEARESIRGFVVDEANQPIAGARVRVPAAANFVVTDAAGQFVLPLLSSRSERPLRITAAQTGYLIGGADVDDSVVQIRLQPLPPDDNSTYDWVDPTPDDRDSQRCGNCHEALYDQWHRGAHAAAGTNTQFMDLYRGALDADLDDGGWTLLDEYPEGAGVCTACHLPSAPLDDLGTTDIREIDGVAKQGVHCDYCHKVQAVDLTAVGLTHGRFASHLLRPHAGATETGQLFFGPLDDVDRGEDSYLPLMSTSEYCAVCHEGTVFGVPVYTTYTEWQQTAAAANGKHCQACHMKPDGKLTNVAAGSGGLERDPQTLASHDLLPGGRLAMLRSCLDLDTDLKRSDQRVDVRVTLTTHDVGHRVPTGFVDRHLILVVEGFADPELQRAVAPLSGETLPDAVGETLRGKAGRVFAKRLSDPDGITPVPFWRAGATALDGRLEPDTSVTVSFAFPATLNRTRVRLLYRRFWSETTEQKQWDDDTLVVYEETQ